MTFFSEKALQVAAKEVSLALVDSLPEPEKCQHIYSPGFERKMAKLLRRARRPALTRGLRNVACFILAVLIGGVVWLTVDTEAREAFFGWVSERVEGAYHYYFHGAGASKKQIERYDFAEVPEGYQEEDIYETDSYTEITYVETATGKYLSLGWLHPSTENATPEIFFLTGDMEREEVRVNGCPAEFYRDDTAKMGNVIVWRNEEADTLLYISGFFDKEFMIEMAENVDLRSNERPLQRYSI